jgi:polysaccharide biosynthesis transport protein
LNYVTETTSPAYERQNIKNRVFQREFGLAELFRLLWRRRGLISGAIVLSLAAATIILMSIKPTYTATTDILIDTKEARVTDLEQVLTETTPDKEALLSEIEVIRSRALIERVIDDFQLVRDPEFNSNLQPLTAIGTVFDSVETLLKGILPEDLFSNSSPSDVQVDQQTSERNEAVDLFMDNLDVGMKGQSRVITIRFTSEEAKKAAQLANAVAESYLLAQLDAKYEATRRANQWLSTKLQDMRQKVADSETAVEQFRSRAGLLQGSHEGTLISQQVTDLNAQLIAARADRTVAEARLQQARQLAQSPSGAEAAAEVLGSPVIVELLRQEAEVKRKVAELADELGDRHPRMVSARAEVSNVLAKIRREINKVVQRLENDAAVARAREASLQNSLTAMEARLAQANTAEVQLRALEREAEANKSTLESFLSRFEEISAQSDLSAHDISARILSRAIVPEIPSAPQKKLILGIVLVAASAFAILLAFAIESLDRGFRSGEQIEDAIGVRTLGLVPDLGRISRGSEAPERELVDNPSSLFGESIRSVYTSILISGTRPTPRSVLITSSQPAEGKSTIAVCLARMCAISGLRTLVIEADLRKPTVHRMMATPQVPGLVEFYRGEATIAEILHQDPSTGAHVLPSGKLVVDPVKVLGSAEVRQLLKTMAQRYDLVLIDTPPIMAVADARVLAPEVDSTAFVVRWGKTHRDVVRVGLKTLMETGAHLTGVVLSRVNAKRHAEYGFGDSGYYYKGVKSYYVVKS